MSCALKHINDPIPPEDWKCPKCGAGNDEFAIWDAVNPECELAHASDIASCTKCGYGATMETIVKKWLKKKSMVKCPHCNGTGYV